MIFYSILNWTICFILILISALIVKYIISHYNFHLWLPMYVFVFSPVLIYRLWVIYPTYKQVLCWGDNLGCSTVHWHNIECDRFISHRILSLQINAIFPGQSFLKIELCCFSTRKEIYLNYAAGANNPVHLFIATLVRFICPLHE